jgi:hypothetical protein
VVEEVCILLVGSASASASASDVRGAKQQEDGTMWVVKMQIEFSLLLPSPSCLIWRRLRDHVRDVAVGHVSFSVEFSSYCLLGVYRCFCSCLCIIVLYLLSPWASYAPCSSLSDFKRLLLLLLLLYLFVIVVVVIVGGQGLSQHSTYHRGE